MNSERSAFFEAQAINFECLEDSILYAIKANSGLLPVLGLWTIGLSKYVLPEILANSIMWEVSRP